MPRIRCYEQAMKPSIGTPRRARLSPNGSGPRTADRRDSGLVPLPQEVAGFLRNRRSDQICAVPDNGYASGQVVRSYSSPSASQAYSSAGVMREKK